MLEYCHPFKTKHTITSGYGVRTHPVTGKLQYHGGVDYASPTGTEVLAICDGLIIRVWKDDLNGNALRLLHADSIRVGYAHLDDVIVEVGDVVKQGQVIAHSGNTGRSTGPHLHLGIYLCVSWGTTDPKDLYDIDTTI
jgi:murein DD-endopeptidase MepM/ murein hydrolase activator NlpD